MLFFVLDLYKFQEVLYITFFREHNSSIYLMLVKAIFYTVALVLFALPGICSAIDNEL